MISKGIHVGLGTDVSGGTSPSILDSLRLALGSSKILGVQKQNNSLKLSF
jgi:cytosine/adenosine deaminase-related metal-dependent hydrolase